MNWPKRLFHICLLIAALIIPALSPAGDKKDRLVVLTTRIPLARLDRSYQFTLYPSGGIAPYRWTVSGAMGSGLQADSNGTISGTPKSPGTYKLSVAVTDSSIPPQKAQSSLDLTVYDGGPPGAIAQSFFGLHDHNRQWPAVSPQVNPFGVIRLWDADVAWSQIEPTQNGPDWTLLDTYTQLAQANGVEIMYEIAWTPTWASSDPTDMTCKGGPGTCDAPADWQTFDDFVTALVSRYTTTGIQVGCSATNPQCHGTIKSYELWNEPFVYFEWNPAQKIYNYNTALTMQGFVKMTQDGQSIIKSIDPNAAVNSFSGDYQFFSQYWATQGAITNFDHVDLHAYPVTKNHQSPYPVPEGMIGQTRQVVDLMAADHITSPLMNTEGSWFLWEPPTQDAQAAYAARYVLLQAAMKMKKSLWDAWTGRAALYSVSPEPGHLTAGGEGYQQVGAWLLGASMRSSGCLDKYGNFQPYIFDCRGWNGTYVVKLSRRRGYKGQVIWYVKTLGDGVDWNATSSYKVPSGFTEYVDLHGNVHPISESRIMVGASPILLQNKSAVGPEMNWPRDSLTVNGPDGDD